MTTPAAAEAAARRWIDGGDAPDPAATGDPLALAWALKALCYEAWRTDPPRGLQAAERLAALATWPLAPGVATEVGALAAWTAGIAALIEGRFEDALQALDRAFEGLSARGRSDEAQQTRVPRIMALSLLGRHDAAADCASSARQALLALGNVAAASRVGLNLGALHLRREAFAESAQHYREAAVLFARIGDHQHSVTADIGQGDALAAMGRFDDALHLYARAAMRAGRHGLAPSQALVDESVALVQLARGRLREALAGLESACARYRELGLPQYQAVAEKQRADVLLELRLLPEALDGLDRALGRFTALALPDERAQALAQRGRALALLGRPRAAEASLARAQALFDAQGTRYGRAQVALARAELALAAGDAARAQALAAAAAADAAASGHAAGAARADALLAQALAAAGDRPAAQALLADTLERAQALQDGLLQVRLLTALAEVGLALGEPVATARTRLESAIERLEAQRQALPGDELRSAFFADRLGPYQARLRLALADGDAAAALLQAERWRARALGELLAGEARDAAADPAAEALREQVRWLTLRVQRERLEGGDAAAAEAALRAAELALTQRLRRQRLDAGASVSAQGAAESEAAPLDLAALQAALQPGDALLEYLALDGELMAFVVTPTAVTLTRQLAAWPAVLAALRAARMQLQALRHGVAPMQAHLALLAERTQARLQALQALIWWPLQPRLAGVRRLLVVPQGPLAGVPFAALATFSAFDAVGPDEQGPVLAIAPSAAVALRGLLRPPRPPRRVLAVGASERLPQARAEALAVVAAYAEGVALVDDRATLAGLRAQAAAADVLHLAGHAAYRADNPRFSALYLHDQVLTGLDAERLPLDGATVVLSGCDTAVAEADAGNELAGLARAFLVAGAARVVASLWPVHDHDAAAFAAAFHARLQAGEGAAAAVRSAQAVLRRAQPHPALWAAFTACGGW